MASLAQDTTRDSKEVLFALEEGSLQRLQQLSLRPGGFGDARPQAWTFLLGIKKTAVSEQDTTNQYPGKESSLSASWTQPSASESSTPSPKGPPSHDIEHDSSQTFDDSLSESSHPDEHQVGLDTNRSFILYPVDDNPTTDRKSLQGSLHDVILGVLRKRPKLRYFQGYHDIITVLFLTLPLEVVIPSAEKLSLHRLRDSMGSGLEPLVGQLRILRRLLRLIDPSYAEILERNSPLPYYALSNLLTLFSHDVPTLPLIQHVFDWLLCHEPIAAIWLAAAVILSRKHDILALEREGDEAMGMMHAVLSAMPALSDNESSMPDVGPGNTVFSEGSLHYLRRSTEDFVDEKEGSEFEASSSDMPEFHPKSTSSNVSNTGADTEDEKRRSSLDEYEVTDDGDTKDSLLDSWTADMPHAFSSSVGTIADSTPEFDPGTVESHLDHQYSDDNHEGTPEAEIRPRHELTSPPRSRSRSLPGGYKEKSPVPPLHISALLHQASELLVTHPPSSPALRLAETFGPQSVLFPSSSSSTVCLADLNDDEADACVGGDNVVIPPTQEEQEEEFGPPRKPRNSDQTSRPGKKGRPMRLAKGVVVRRQTVVAGVVLLLGVAVALYGIGPGGRGHIRNNSGLGRLGLGGERWVAAWVGGLLGVGQRLGVGI